MQLTSKELLILYYLLKEEDSITAEQLSKYASTSVRTVRTKVNQIGEKLKKEGFMEIESIHAKGYRVKEINKVRCKDFKNSIKSSRNFYRKVGIEKMTRRIYLSQQLLSTDYIKLEDLAKQLYITVSGLKKDMNWVHRFFNSYEVLVKAKPGYGLYIEGKEENLRELMVEAFCSQYNFIDDKVDEFSAMFYDDFDEYQRIRRTFLKIIRESHYAFTDISSKKISTYLVLARNRCKNKHYVRVEDSVKEELEDTYEFILANEAFKIESLFDRNEIIEDEIYYLALLLILVRDYDFTNNKTIETYHRRYINETLMLLSRIVKEASKVFCPAIYQMDLFTRYENRFLSPLYNIYLNYVFTTNKQWPLTTYYEGLEKSFSPVAAHYARIILLTMEKELGVMIDKSKINEFIILFDLLLKKVNYPYKKRRLALLSVAGHTVANEYKDIILEKFSQFIEYIDIFIQYEMRRIDFNDYDIGIIDHESLMNYYPIELVNYPLLGLEESTLPLFKKVFYDGYSTDTIEFMKNITNVYEDFECQNHKMLFKLFSYKYCDERNVQAFEKALFDYEYKFSFYNRKHKIALVICDYHLINKSFIDIYKVNKKMRWNNKDEDKVEFIIAVSIPYDLKISEVKTINKVLFALSIHPTLCIKLYEDIGETYQEIFEEIMTSHFIRG